MVKKIRFNRGLFLGVIFCFLLSACASSLPEESALSGSSESDSAEESVLDPAEPARQLEFDYEAQNGILVDQYNRREVRPEPPEAYNAFMKALIKAWYETGNTADSVISPYSMYETLAMLSDFTDEALAEKILTVLCCSDETSLDAERALLQAATEGNSEEFSSCNSLWLDSASEFHEEKVAESAVRLDSEIFRLDFSAGPAEEKIAQWISEKTKGALQKEAGDQSFGEKSSSLKTAVILNALYFRSGFALGHSRGKAAFHNADGTVKEVEFGGVSETVYAYENERFYSVRVIVGPESILTILMPKEGVFLNAEDEEAFSYLLGTPDGYELCGLNVRFSYFKVGGEALDAEPLLNAMGLQDLFRPGAVKKLIAGKEGEECMIQFLNAAMTAHSSEGITAAAYSEVVTYIGLIEPKDNCLCIDHPFLFALSLGDCVLTVGSVDKL